MHMRVDESREDILSRCVDDFRTVGRSEVTPDLGDGFVFAEDIRDIAFACGDDLTALDEETHYFFQTSPTPSPNQRMLTTFCWV